MGRLRGLAPTFVTVGCEDLFGGAVGVEAELVALVGCVDLEQGEAGGLSCRIDGRQFELEAPHLREGGGVRGQGGAGLGDDLGGGELGGVGAGRAG